MNFDDFSAKLEAEKAFWAGRKIDTFDMVDPWPYDGRTEMEKQFVTYYGEWVRAEDYRRDVERLEQRIKDLELNR